MSLEFRDLSPMVITDATSNPFHLLGEHEVASAYARVHQYEIDYKHYMSPQQKAWFMGARAAFAFVLGLPKGGLKIREMLAGKNVFGIVDPLAGTRAHAELGLKLE